MLFNLLGDDDLNVNTWGDVHVGDVLNLGRGGLEVDDSLVDSHLESIEGVGTFTARTLSDGESEDLGGESDGAGSSDLADGALGLEASANLLEVGNVSAGDSDADLVNLLLLGSSSL